MNEILSPNFNDRAANIELTSIVVHYTGMKDAPSAVARLCDPASKVGAHYVIDESGNTLPLIDESKRAWHAGESFWRGMRDMNSASIGIELVNPGHEFGYHPFPEAQIAAFTKLARDIIARRALSARTALLAHSDIAPTRKQDPGELFPWQLLAQEGLGLWPAPLPEDFIAVRDGEIVEKLGAIGYDTASVSDTLLAFQRRYYPENMTGFADPETVARIRALKRQWNA